MAHPAYRGRRWTEVRHEVLERDDWTCALCGKPIDRNLPPGSHDRAGTADHIVPVSDGGRWWALRNLRAAHVSCNRARANATRHRGVRKYPNPRTW